MATTAPTSAIDQADLHAHWLRDLPYRALVYIKDSQHGVPLYQVAGRTDPPCKASRALKVAFAFHGGQCFYCSRVGEKVSAHLNTDHVDAVCKGRNDLLHNLVVACTECNRKKGALPIEAFRPNAGREWLLAAQALIRARLELIEDQDEDPSSQSPQKAAPARQKK